MTLRHGGITVLLLLSLTAPAVAQPYQFGDEPAFLKDVGPQDVRSDNPAAAAVTALVVGLVFYRGFRTFRTRRDAQHEPAPTNDENGGEETLHD